MKRRLHPFLLAFVVAVAAALAVNRRLERRWGASDREVSAALPGDELIQQPDWQTTHAVTIHGLPADIWPWLLQMGFGRAGWYTSAWFDRLIWRVPSRTSDRLVPELQQMEVGQQIPDGPEGTAYLTVVTIEPQRAIVFRSARHPITGLPPDVSSPTPGPYVDFSWVFVIDDAGDGTSRLLLRTRAIARPRAILLAAPLLDFADFLYVRQILKGIKRRVERERRGNADEIRRARPARSAAKHSARR